MPRSIILTMIGRVAGNVGKGLAAGLVGTAAMTISSTIEAKLRQRESSDAPAQAASKVLGLEPKDDAAKARFSNLVHWGYGTSWGAVRGLLGSLGLPAPLGGLAHLGAIWGSELVMLPRLEVAPPVSEWGGTELAVDGFHHSVYALATSLAYAWFDRTS
ncbi:hypothetical protein BH18ACT1_BH18ACT1_11620 [soil metagenome]